MKTYFITGGAGFIGSSLSEQLIKKGNKVVAIDNFCDFYNPKIKENNIKELQKNPNFKIYKKDIRDKQSIKKIFDENNIDIVMHLAAMAGVRPSIENPVLYQEVNCMGTQNILEEMKAHNIKNLVMASSSSVYGDDGTQKSPYAVSKATNELQAAMYSNLSNTKFTGLRFFTVYGEGIREDLAISKFIKSIKNNEPIYVYGDGTQSRDFTYVDDITEAISLILESDKEWKNEVFDIGYGESTTVNELIEILKEFINPTFDKVVYQDEKPYDVKATLANTNKLYEWFGFKPKYNIKKGLQKWQTELK